MLRGAKIEADNVKNTLLCYASFFFNSKDIKVGLGIIAKYDVKPPRRAIIASFRVSHCTVEKY